MNLSDLNQPANPAREARLRPLASHRKVHAQAAQVAADWPAPAEVLAIGHGAWPYGSSEGFQLRRDAADQQEVAQLVREALLELIQPVVLLSIKANRATGAVAGQFKSRGQTFDYSIDPRTGITYKPAGQSRQDAQTPRHRELEHRIEAARALEQEAAAELELAQVRRSEALRRRRAAEIRADLEQWSQVRRDAYEATASRLDRVERWG